MPVLERPSESECREHFKTTDFPSFEEMDGFFSKISDIFQKNKVYLAKYFDEKQVENYKPWRWIASELHLDEIETDEEALLLYRKSIIGGRVVIDSGNIKPRHISRSMTVGKPRKVKSELHALMTKEALRLRNKKDYKNLTPKNYQTLISGALVNQDLYFEIIKGLFGLLSLYSQMIITEKKSSTKGTLFDLLEGEIPRVFISDRAKYIYLSKVVGWLFEHVCSLQNNNSIRFKKGPSPESIKQIIKPYRKKKSPSSAKSKS